MTESDKIKARWQEYIGELYGKEVKPKEHQVERVGLVLVGN